ncbi:MAG: VCBS repeat-containing protein, partial [Labilithrix sp.]|nr:VCBS repeat-containing protein [Labilithrix sp.]
MLKRLSFALVAVSFTVPVVACLHQNEAQTDGAAAHLDEETKAACNFGFDPVAQPLPDLVALGGGESPLLAPARLVFGRFDKDDKLDLVRVRDKNNLQFYKGQGDGTFKVGAEEKLGQRWDSTRTRTSLAIVGIGNFDGDDYDDVLVAQTSVPKNDENGPEQIEYRIVYGTKDGDPAFWNQKTIPAVTEKVLYHVIGDLDGDGKDDVVIVTATSQTALFGGANRNVQPVSIAYANAAERRFAFYSPKAGKKPAGLVLVTDDKIATLTFDATPAHAATAVETPWTSFVKGATRLGGDLDRDGKSELAILSDTLTITSIDATKQSSEPLTFATLSGRAKAALDLDKNGKGEIVFAAADDSKLYAACGYGPTAKAVAAVELPIPYSADTFIAGTPDLNGDGKPDLVTVPVGGGEAKVYLAGAPAAPAPALTFFESNLAEPPPPPQEEDAGPDPDATVEEEDAGPARTDAGEPQEEDAGEPPPPPPP